jgi:hypothetical protein
MDSGYRALCMISHSSTVTLADVESALWRNYNAKQSDVSVKLVETGLCVDIAGWKLRVQLNAKPWVAEESREIAQQFGQNRPDRNILSMAARRFEVSSDPDPDMDYFNVYVGIIEAIESIADVVCFEPGTGEFI